LAARVLTGHSPFGLVKTSGSSHGGEHSAAVKMEASNPCINETDKVIRSPEGDLYRRAFRQSEGTTKLTKTKRKQKL
jgi:hypothetical protein